MAIAFLMVEMPTAASKYSLFAASSSFSTWDAVYMRTFKLKKKQISIAELA